MSGDNGSLLAPHSIEAEEAVLGGVLINPRAIVDLLPFLRVDDFFIMRNSLIWNAMLRLHERNEVVDNLTIMEELRTSGHLEEIDGGAYIAYLITNTPTSLHCEIYGKIVQRAASRRRLLEVAGRIAELANAEDKDLSEVQGAAYQLLVECIGDQDRALVNHADAVDEYRDYVEDVLRNKDTVRVVASGLGDLDNKLSAGGFQPGQLIVISGPSGSGKSTLMYNIAVDAALKGKRGLYVSLEMTAREMIMRVLAQKTGIDSRKLARVVSLSDSEIDTIFALDDQVANMALVYDEKSTTMTEIRSNAEVVKIRHGLDFVIIDYVGLLSSFDDRKSDKRHQELDRMARAAKRMAVDLGCPVLLGSQVNSEGGPFGSSMVLAHSDVVLRIEENVEGDFEDGKPGLRIVRIVKQRNGAKGPVTVYHDPTKLLFTNAATQHIDLGAY